ncbi:MAG: amidohydrolase family protein [Thermaerobacter sp.]|nr:amidohydrolase family protein [Thermaerobacter sp.]
MAADDLPLVVDVHAHDIPRNFLAALRRNEEAFGARLEDRNGRLFAVHKEGHAHPIWDEFTDVEAKLRDMDRRGIQTTVLSPGPAFFGYRRDPGAAAEMAALLNDGTAEMIEEGGGRLLGMAVAPMQDPRRAVAELERAVKAYGYRGVEIGSDIAGTPLSDPSLREFFARCEELDLLVLVHPYFNGVKPRMEQYYLTNLFGNPFDTALSIADVLLSGMLDELPRLKLLYVHGGGFLPYQMGRLRHGYKVRPETRKNTPRSPEESFRQLYFDTLTHDPAALRFLVGMVGAERVFLGTDLPFDMADGDPVATLDATSLSVGERRQIAGGNAAAHFAAS